MVVCDCCDRRFISKNSTQRFCSRECKTTYHNRTKRGLPLKGYISPYHGSPEHRFWIRINKNGSIPLHCPELGKCWEWTGKKDSNGYGQLKINYKSIRSHRYSYQIHKGPIPTGYEICHKCDNPACVNPEHLWADTHKNNMIDCYKRGRFNSFVNFSILHGTNLNLLSKEQIDKCIENLSIEQKRRL